MHFLKFLVNFFLNRYVRQLDQFHLKHDGEECYIFGTGTSLKWMDIKQFKDKPSILGNFSIYHKDMNDLNIPYCAMIEPFSFYPLQPRYTSGKLRFVRNQTVGEFLKVMKKFSKTCFFINTSNFPTTYLLTKDIFHCFQKAILLKNEAIVTMEL